MIVSEIHSKTILSASKIYDYVINPYTGCQHACSYCYARFMKKYTGHTEAWGDFVDVKVNAPELLEKELRKKRRGTVWMSGVCDPYQPLEANYNLTGRCLAILAGSGWPVSIQTRSPLILRDIGVLRRGADFQVGFSIGTADDGIRTLFEPAAPPIGERLRALGELHNAGIMTYAMIAPILPGAERLVRELNGRVDRIIIDRMNYHYADWIYRTHGLEAMRSDDYFEHMARELKGECEKQGIGCTVVL